MPSHFVKDGDLTAIFCTVIPAFSVCFALYYVMQTRKIILDPAQFEDKTDRNEAQQKLVINHNDDGTEITPEQAKKVWDVYNMIFEGAHAFLFEEYRYIACFVIAFSFVILIVLGVTNNWHDAGFTVIAFLVGCSTSVLAGFIGMKIGVFANARTAIQCRFSLAEGFTTSFKAAVVMGFCLCSLGVFNLYVMIMFFRAVKYRNAMKPSHPNETDALFEAIAGYGLGGSTIALFGRVGGGIYTKAADVGADLVGKVEAGIPEDDPRNPAVIADNVGDNVGDIAGMGADLFGSFAESSCAALVIGSQSNFVYNGERHHSLIWQHWGYVSYPLIISCTGLVVCFITSFLATHLYPPKNLTDVEPTVKMQLLSSTFLMSIALLLVTWIFLPNRVLLKGENEGKIVYYWHIYLCAASGLWCGLAIGYITEYFTCNQYTPVQELAHQCITGAATNIIIGLALGYKSVIIPVAGLAIASFVSHSLAGFYGVALAALGILSTLSIGLTIDAFGPISDNAGGIAEMCELGEETRQRTDALDAAGNTTAAIGKGFAIGSAAFVSLALFSGYMTILQTRESNDPKGDHFSHVDLLHPFPFAGVLVGAMLPYWFTALTMASVGRAATKMVEEVRRQFHEKPGILRGDERPDYALCIEISTKASLIEMIAPGALVMGTPLTVGFLFGCKALAGVLIGALVSGIQIAISAANTGGAWDNAKKYIEQGKLFDPKTNQPFKKGSEAHKAAVVGDTVGDPLKDTSGPSLNILIKLMAVESLVFARAFPIHDQGLFGYIAKKIGNA